MKEDITLIISSSNSVRDFLFLVVNKYIKYILCLKKKCKIQSETPRLLNGYHYRSSLRCPSFGLISVCAVFYLQVVFIIRLRVHSSSEIQV